MQHPKQSHCAALHGSSPSLPIGLVLANLRDALIKVKKFDSFATICVFQSWVVRGYCCNTQFWILGTYIPFIDSMVLEIYIYIYIYIKIYYFCGHLTIIYRIYECISTFLFINLMLSGSYCLRLTCRTFKYFSV